MGKATAVVGALLVGAVLFAILVVGCTKDPIRTDRTDNPQLKLDLLFEHDGVKVYRFEDAGHYVYYTDARGRTSWSDTEMMGKTVITVPKSVETVVRDSVTALTRW